MDDHRTGQAIPKQFTKNKTERTYQSHRITKIDITILIQIYFSLYETKKEEKQEEEEDEEEEEEQQQQQ